MQEKRLWPLLEAMWHSTATRTRKVVFIIGTRPEAIKLALLVKEFRRYPTTFTPLVVVTAQHREMLDQVLCLFRITPDYDLNIMTHDQALTAVTVKMLAGIEDVLKTEIPDLVVVQGDTTTALVGALASFYRKIPVAHVEAGLRTTNRLQPFPEEVNRRLISALADLHFAPTVQARSNLLREGIAPEVVWVTGNTVIDALLWAFGQPFSFPQDLVSSFVGSHARCVLVTVHRRENWGAPLHAICKSLIELVQAISDLEIYFPVHLSPHVRREVLSSLTGYRRIHLLSPLDYLTFVNVLRRVNLVLTDSGGIQEEASFLGIPVLVLRNITERPEVILAGAGKLVGTDPKFIVSEVRRLLSGDVVCAASRLYGGGNASSVIVEHVARHFGLSLKMQAGVVRQ